MKATVWFTGLSGAGKSTVALTLHDLLEKRDVQTVRLDGDDLREGLCSDLGFSDEDRQENVRRVGELAMLFAKHGHLTLVTVISPFAAGRKAVRARHQSWGIPFVEVHVATPLSVCEERDPKGLYARARRGEVPSFTGISAPYEEPAEPELFLNTVGSTPHESASTVLELLESLDLLD
jgi:adenylyl-sulfate kinase